MSLQQHKPERNPYIPHYRWFITEFWAALQQTIKYGRVDKCDVTTETFFIVHSDTLLMAVTSDSTWSQSCHHQAQANNGIRHFVAFKQNWKSCSNSQHQITNNGQCHLQLVSTKNRDKRESTQRVQTSTKDLSSYPIRPCTSQLITANCLLSLASFRPSKVHLSPAS